MNLFFHGHFLKILLKLISSSSVNVKLKYLALCSEQDDRIPTITI